MMGYDGELGLCRFMRDGEPDIGEYIRLKDGTGMCRLTEMDGGGEMVMVHYPDGTMPEGISDVELVHASGAIDESDVDKDMDLEALRDGRARTGFILDEYRMGVLDGPEAGAALFARLFPDPPEEDHGIR